MGDAHGLEPLSGTVASPAPLDAHCVQAAQHCRQAPEPSTPKRQHKPSTPQHAPRTSAGAAGRGGSTPARGPGSGAPPSRAPGGPPPWPGPPRSPPAGPPTPPPPPPPPSPPPSSRTTPLSSLSPTLACPARRHASLAGGRARQAGACNAAAAAAAAAAAPVRPPLRSSGRGSGSGSGPGPGLPPRCQPPSWLLSLRSPPPPLPGLQESRRDSAGSRYSGSVVSRRARPGGGRGGTGPAVGWTLPCGGTGCVGDVAVVKR